jgi:hypothetical protein
MPSAICYQQVGADQWHEHFCLVNPECILENEDEASDMAVRDLAEAFKIKSAGGNDQQVAASLRGKGYMILPHFRRVTTPTKSSPETR